MIALSFCDIMTQNDTHHHFRGHTCYKYSSWRAVVTAPIYNAVVNLCKGVVTNYREERLQNGRGDK